MPEAYAGLELMGPSLEVGEVAFDRSDPPPQPVDETISFPAMNAMGKSLFGKASSMFGGSPKPK